MFDAGFKAVLFHPFKVTKLFNLGKDDVSPVLKGCLREFTKV